jgi:photosystem II stability/assembly factor-like uncharacterized protein
MRMRPVFTILPFLILVFSSGVDAQWTIKHLDEDACTVKTTIRFRNDSLGLMMGYNATVLKSVDAGETWEEINPGFPIHIEDFQFAGSTVVYAVGEYDTEAGHVSMFLRSPDNGYTWDSITAFPGMQLQCLWFIDHDTGMVAGFDAILRTADGGNAWDTVWSITGSGYQYGELVDITFSDHDTGYAIGVGRTQNNENLFENFAVKTTDSGITWDTIHIFNRTTLQTLCFLDPDTGFVGTEDGSICKTVDGGETWNEHKIANLPVLSVHFPSDQVGYATGSSDIMILDNTGNQGFFISKTEDGGEHWETYDTAGVDLHSIHFLNDSVGFVSGNYNLIMKSGGEITGLPGDYPWHLVQSGHREETGPVDAPVTIYPNPTPGMVTIDTGKPGPYTVIVSDLNGRLLFSGDCTGPTCRIDLSSFSRGTYIISVRSPEYVVKRKISRL